MTYQNRGIDTEQKYKTLVRCAISRNPRYRIAEDFYADCNDDIDIFVQRKDNAGNWCKYRTFSIKTFENCHKFGWNLPLKIGRITHDGVYEDAWFEKGKADTYIFHKHKQGLVIDAAVLKAAVEEYVKKHPAAKTESPTKSGVLGDNTRKYKTNVWVKIPVTLLKPLWNNIYHVFPDGYEKDENKETFYSYLYPRDLEG